jgi:hypothetical protein
MKKLIITILLLLLSNIAISQPSNPHEKDFKNVLDSLALYFYNSYDYLKISQNFCKQRQYRNAFLNKKSEYNLVSIGNLVDTLIESTQDDFNNESLIQQQINYFHLYRKSKTDKTNYIIHLLTLELIHTELKKREHLNPVHKKVLIEALSEYIQLISKIDYQDYTYQHDNPQLIKFFTIKTNNDLFLLPRFIPSKHRPQSLENLDMDYTGGLLAEIGTDFLRLRSNKPKKMYQTILYGFEVHTPYFRDTLKFTKNDTFNVLDRPHGNFQFGGFSFNGLSRSNGYRWSSKIKIGKIGSGIGRVFQDVLHQDVSSSIKSLGWPSQIANNGRLGFSLEHRSEFQVALSKNELFKKKWFPYCNVILEARFGSYKTNIAAGYAISNNSFSKVNMHHIRNVTSREGFKINYKIETTLTYNQHNSMLEGYGWVKNNLPDSCLRSLNKHYLKRSQIYPIISLTEITLGLSTKNFSAFIIHSIRSPELRYAGAVAKAENGDFVYVNKWFNYGTLGISFHGF